MLLHLLLLLLLLMTSMMMIFRSLFNQPMLCHHHTSCWVAPGLPRKILGLLKHDLLHDLFDEQVAASEHFCRTMLCISLPYAVIRCLPVCPSDCLWHLCILLKRVIISSKFFHHQLVTPLSFFCTKRYSNIPMGSRSWTAGVWLTVSTVK